MHLGFKYVFHEFEILINQETCNTPGLVFFDLLWFTTFTAEKYDTQMSLNWKELNTKLLSKEVKFRKNISSNYNLN